MPDRRLSALLVDYGGVLTSSLQDCLGAWCEADALDPAEASRAIRELSAGGDADPVHALERGEIDVGDFECRLAARLRTRDGRPVPAEGLLTRMFAGFGRDGGMVGVVARARRSGIRTCLVSNSWGLDYPRHDWDVLFDGIVVSGEVGMRKPEPRIYRYAAELVGAAPAECVFVDDLPVNVEGAVALGMVGVRHRSTEQTVSELEVLFDRSLRAE